MRFFFLSVQKTISAVQPKIYTVLNMMTYILPTKFEYNRMQELSSSSPQMTSENCWRIVEEKSLLKQTNKKPHKPYTYENLCSS